VFGRSESARERTLLRLIENQQRTISELVSQIMHLTGRTWLPPPFNEEPMTEAEEEQPMYSAFHGLPPTEEHGTEPE